MEDRVGDQLRDQQDGVLAVSRVVVAFSELQELTRDPRRQAGGRKHAFGP